MAYLNNMQRQARRRYHDVAGETALERQTRIREQGELVTTLAERVAMWRRSVEMQLHETGALIQKMGPAKRLSSEGERLRTHLARLQQDLVEIDGYKALPLISNTHSLEAIDADQPYYHEVPRDKAYDFFNKLLDLEVATNFWNYVRGSVPIEDNLYSEVMGAVMAQTFVIGCYNAWDCVLRPRCENAALQERHVDKDFATVHSQCKGKPFKEHPGVVYNKVKDVQPAMFSGKPGIEAVLVPAMGPHFIGRASGRNGA